MHLSGAVILTCILLNSFSLSGESGNLSTKKDVAITICYGLTSPDIAGHPGLRANSYLSQGNNIDVNDFTGYVTTEHWYVLRWIDVQMSSESSGIVIPCNPIE